jgi:hypothetical protein
MGGQAILHIPVPFVVVVVVAEAVVVMVVFSASFAQ